MLLLTSFSSKMGRIRPPSLRLVGSSNYVKALSTVANESYPQNYTQGNPVIVSGIAGTRTLTYLQ